MQQILDSCFVFKMKPTNTDFSQIIKKSLPHIHTFTAMFDFCFAIHKNWIG